MIIKVKLTEIDICALHDLVDATQERMEFVKQYPEFVKDENAIVDLDEQLNFLMKIEKAL